MSDEQVINDVVGNGEKRLREGIQAVIEGKTLVRYGVRVTVGGVKMRVLVQVENEA